MASKAFGSKGPDKPHLVRGSGGLQAEVQDLRDDVEEAMVTLESLSGYPQLTQVVGGGAIDKQDPTATYGVVGSDLLQDQVAATLTLGLTTASLAFTANRPGTDGNSITVALTTGVGALSVAVVGTAITVTLAAAGSTAAAVKAAIDADADAHALVQVAVSGGGGGTVLDAVATALSGGVGSGFEVLLNGVDQTVVSAVTATGFTAIFDLSGISDADSAALQVRTNGRLTNTLSLAIRTPEADYPLIGKVTGGTSVSIAGSPVAAAIAGDNFLQGQSFASYTFGTGAASLAFSANRPGTPGNSITVELATGGALSVAVVGTAITVTLNTGTSTAADVKAAVDAYAAAHALVQVAVSGGGGDPVVVAAATPLAGGVGSGVEVLVNNLEQTVNGTITDTAIAMAVSDFTGSANGDSASLVVVSNGHRSNALTLGIVT